MYVICDDGARFGDMFMSTLRSSYATATSAAPALHSDSAVMLASARDMRA